MLCYVMLCYVIMLYMMLYIDYFWGGIVKYFLIMMIPFLLFGKNITNNKIEYKTDKATGTAIPIYRNLPDLLFNDMYISSYNSDYISETELPMKVYVKSLGKYFYFINNLTEQSLEISDNLNTEITIVPIKTLICFGAGKSGYTECNNSFPVSNICRISAPIQLCSYLTTKYKIKMYNPKSKINMLKRTNDVYRETNNRNSTALNNFSIDIFPNKWIYLKYYSEDRDVLYMQFPVKFKHIIYEHENVFLVNQNFNREFNTKCLHPVYTLTNTSDANSVILTTTGSKLNISYTPSIFDTNGEKLINILIQCIEYPERTEVFNFILDYKVTYKNCTIDENCGENDVCINGECHNSSEVIQCENVRNKQLGESCDKNSLCGHYSCAYDEEAPVYSFCGSNGYCTLPCSSESNTSICNDKAVFRYEENDEYFISGGCVNNECFKNVCGSKQNVKGFPYFDTCKSLCVSNFSQTCDSEDPYIYESCINQYNDFCTVDCENKTTCLTECQNKCDTIDTTNLSILNCKNNCFLNNMCTNSNKSIEVTCENGKACIPSEGDWHTCGDRCSIYSCSNHGICENSEYENRSYCNCDYSRGYYQSTDGLDCINPCENADCGLGTCQGAGNYYFCLCREGAFFDYINNKCVSNPCEEVTCSGHGTCEVNYGTMTASCVCDTGYEVLNSQNEADCVGNRCSKDSDCSNGKLCNGAYYEDTITTLQETILRCSEPEGIKDYTSYCQDTDECKSGFCIDDVCSKPCLNTDDCIQNNINNYNCSIIVDDEELKIYTKLCDKTDLFIFTQHCDFTKNYNQICPEHNNCLVNLINFGGYPSDIEYNCVKFEGNGNNEECKSVEDCISGRCIFNGENITNICNINKITRQGVCIGTNISCVSQDDCNYSGYCSGVKTGEECLNDSDCIYGFCYKNKCEVPCLNDSNCNFPDGQKQCVNEFEVYDNYTYLEQFNLGYSLKVGICK